MESRANKKRCMGRITKHLGDLNLQTGFLHDALNCYQTAIDTLRSCNDWLWLGGNCNLYLTNNLKWSTNEFIITN